MKGLNQDVREWYMERYPWDCYGKNILLDITFQDILNDLHCTRYFLGTTDSVLRERVFHRLEDLSSLTYIDIYLEWAGFQIDAYSSPRTVKGVIASRKWKLKYGIL